MSRRRGISYEEAVTILEQGKQGVLSMCDQDGTPYGIPLNYYYDKEEQAIYFHCFIRGKKISILQENPKVSFCVVGHSQICEERYVTHYESAIASGAATIITDPEEKTKRLIGLCEHLTPTAISRRDEVIKKELPAVAIVKISVTEVSGKRNQDD